MPLSLGQRILLEAKARGHSQMEAAKTMGVHQQQVSRWIAGQSHPSWMYAKPLATYLRCDLADVLLLLHAAHTGAEVAPQTAKNPDSLVKAVYQLVQRVDQLGERVNLLEDRCGGWSKHT